MRSLSSIIFILMCLMLAACVPQSPKSKRRSTAGAATTEPTPTPAPPAFAGDAYWYNGSIVNGTINIPEDFASVIYLRGQAINNFLAQTSGAMNSAFCLVVGFNAVGAKDQFRARAVPMSFNNFQTGQLERLLRIDVNLSSNECQGNIGNLGTLTAKAPFYHSSNRVYLGVSNGTTGKGLYYSTTPTVSFDSRAFNDVKDINGSLLLSNHVTSIYSHSSTVAIGTQSGLGISYDSAATITAPVLFKNKNISAIGGLPTMWGVASGSQLWLTGNDGASFTSVSLDPTNPIIKEITGHDGVTDYLFIATNAGLWYSNNSGASFHSLTNFPTNGIVARDNILYAATNTGVDEYNISGPSPVFVRTINTGHGLASNIVHDVSVSNSVLYIATSGGLSMGTHPGGTSFPNTVLSGGEPIAVSANATKAAVVMSGGASLFFNGMIPASPVLVTNTLELDDVCPTCSSLTSNSLAIYQIQAGSIDDTSRITGLDATLGTLSLRISGDGETSGGGSCSNSACQAQGYDCCLDNQCVIDASIRPNASSHPDYNQALADIANNPLLFVNYPDIYYVCTQAPPPTSTPTPTPDAIATAAARLQEEYAQYLCLEGAKLDPPDYSACIDGDGDGDHDIDDWHLIRLRVWDRCGCEADPMEEPYCPDYGLTAEVDSGGNPISVSCLIPPPDVMPTPFQNLTINLSARTVPHRFFRSTDGTKVDDISTISNLTPEIVPEGTPFAYLDESGHTVPLDSSFNMNDVLGQMKVNLTRAIPAKVIKLEFGADYIISGTSGLYTPCPQCSRDAWYDSFTAYPTSTGGLGVQPVGYTTRRDNLSNNASLGNYEDAIFGRACWIPPTMVPFSHKPGTTVPQQREARLRTQVALWANGYQRDWFGFNKGALIGSFDGVKWFAIGGGRKVTSASETLFLAINAPFGDLADNTDITVNIVADLGNNSVATVDFDPALTLNDPRQNRAGSCQRFHMCEKDIDCVTRLGWEYTCANVDNLKLSWPRFNAAGDELTGENGSFDLEDIVFNNEGLLGGPKRCVYRGAGVPCARNWSALALEKQEILRCAPNFYCAEIDDNVFNDRVVREPAAVQTYLYGQESDVLGRPLNYIHAFNNLPPDIKANLEHNATKMGIALNNLGICRPGKSLESNVITQHDSEDPQARTDFINQISSCPSNLSNDQRVRSCPAFDEEGNYYDGVNTGSIASNALRSTQNMCGAEWKTGTESLFKNVEAEPLNTLASLFEPRVVMDACLRRAGSVCHTDLDCGPNRLHSQEALLLDPYAFGGANGNLPEYKYWTESLVCRQGANPPSVFADDYEDYDMSLNKCCREQGSDLTMYTRIDYNEIVDGDLDLSEISLITDLGALGEDTTSGNKRYSRYSILNDANFTAPATSELDKPKATYPRNSSRYVSNTYDNPAWQWKAINDTGNQTCCGGGWIRKFADGTHDWTNNKRLNLVYTNFKCLNYENTLHIEKPSEVLDGNWELDQSKLCLYPSENGCVDKGIKTNDDISTIVPPSNIPSSESSGTLSTMIDENQEQHANAYAYYLPQIVPHTWGHSTPGSPHGTSEYTMFPSPLKNFTNFFLPLYIGHPDNILDVSFVFQNEDGDEIITLPNEIINFYNPGGYCNPVLHGSCPYTFSGDYTTCNAATLGTFANLVMPVGTTTQSGVRCVERFNYNGKDYYSFMAIANRNIQVLGKPWVAAGVKIRFKYYGYHDNSNGNNAADLSGDYNGAGRGMRAGNANYYETKLARLELLGIPQVFYEPLYCNSGREQLVPGLYKDISGNSRSSFNSNSIIYDEFIAEGSSRRLDKIYDEEGTHLYSSDASKTGGVGRVIFKDKINHGDIFSGHEFMCCRQVGNVTESASRCCSNFAMPNDNDELVCMIPKGTNLNVYFNKFVSSEGIGEDLPGGGLLETDFIPETGEPKLNNSVRTKIETLGLAYCQNQAVRSGAAFGSFYPQPNTGSFVGNPEEGRTFGIIDSPTDYDPDNDTGTLVFQQGYRWNHHVYCQ